MKNMFFTTPLARRAGFKKILVTGLGRSGTSAAASILFHFGYCLTESPQIRNHEDPHLRDLLKDGKVDEIVDILKARSAKNTHVAWKDPKIYGRSGPNLVGKLGDDWLVVVIYRDPIAIAMRRALSEQAEFSADLARVITGQKKLVEFADGVAKTRAVLYVSYEKMLTDPVGFINEFAEYIDWPNADLSSAEIVWEKALGDRALYRAGDR
jgi:hypothetical protein